MMTYVLIVGMTVFVVYLFVSSLLRKIETSQSVCLPNNDAHSLANTEVNWSKYKELKKEFMLRYMKTSI